MRHPGKASAGRAGRPLLPKDELRSEIIRMRATKAEKDNYDKRGGNTWLRQQLTKTDKQTGVAQNAAESEEQHEVHK